MIPIDPDRRATPRPIDDFLVEDKARGDYRLHRSAFTDEMLFELEMKHIFEGNWIYLAHESQLPNANDYYTITIGRQPIVIARNRHGELNAFVNACTHRGAMLCCAATSAATARATRARSTAGRSATTASCSK